MLGGATKVNREATEGEGSRIACLWRPVIQGQAVRATKLAWLVAWVVLGCGSSAADDAEGEVPTPPVFDYLRDDELRLNHLQLKATHNSYHVEKEGNTVNAWRYTHAPLDVQLAEQGVRAVELDVYYDSDTDTFGVYHVPTVDDASNCPELTDCLQRIASWSAAHPAHHPVIVQLEIKRGIYADNRDEFIAKLEATITSVLPRERLVIPDDVRGDAPSLREAVLDRGWPTLKQTRGKVIFVVDDSSDFREAYTHSLSSLDGRLMFVDSSPEHPFAGFRVINDPIARRDEIEESVRAGFIVRTRADGDVERQEGQIEAALESGAHVVSTDFPVPVEGGLPHVEIPGGTPSRCNPIAAPSECTSRDIENPEFMR